VAYTLPTFNTMVKVYDGGAAPQDVVWSSVSSYQCQQYSGWKFRYYNTPLGTTWAQHLVQFRFEPTAFYTYFTRYDAGSWAISLLYMDSLGGGVYRAVTWETANVGFPNEYPFVIAFLCRGDGMPIHPGSAINAGFPGGWPYQMGPIP